MTGRRNRGVALQSAFCRRPSHSAGDEFYLTDIRVGREKPGLRPQHLKAIEALKQICQGSLDDGEIGSGEKKFKPDGGVKGGYYVAPDSAAIL